VRVLLVNAHGTDTSRGGAEHNLAALAHGYLERGLEVSLLAGFPGKQAVHVPTAVLHRDDWVEHPSRRLRNHIGTLTARPTRRLRKVVADFRPDVVHTNNLPGITTAIWEVARSAGVPVVHGLHDYHLLCPRVTLMQPDGSMCRPHPLLCGLRTRRLARWADAVSHVHGPSQYILTRHAGFFGDVPSTVIRHPRAQPPGRQLAPPGDKLRTIGFIGALNPTKGVDVVLEALPALRRLGLEIRIAGHGRLRPEVEAAQVVYAGTVAGAAKDDFFEACDLGVVPSVWPEPAGPPFALLDWLSAGRPVISSRRGGLAESAGLPGVQTIEPTADELVAAVERLVEPAAWKRALGEVPPSFETGEHERWIDEHERLLREAVA
jgi:glycosyltransferase involved in cell wall biosynthesis